MLAMREEMRPWNKSFDTVFFFASVVTGIQGAYMVSWA